MKRLLKRGVDATIVPMSYYLATKVLWHPAFDYQGALRREIADLRAEVSAKTPGNPCAYGFKVYSQCDEDGIIEYILSKLGDLNRSFIEIGCGRGVENNTHYLLLKGYRGCWVDGSPENIAIIQNGLGGLHSIACG